MRILCETQKPTLENIDRCIAMAETSKKDKILTFLTNYKEHTYAARNDIPSRDNRDRSMTIGPEDTGMRASPSTAVSDRYDSNLCHYRRCTAGIPNIPSLRALPQRLLDRKPLTRNPISIMTRWVLDRLQLKWPLTIRLGVSRPQPSLLISMGSFLDEVRWAHWNILHNLVTALT